MKPCCYIQYTFLPCEIFSACCCIHVSLIRYFFNQFCRKQHWNMVINLLSPLQSSGVRYQSNLIEVSAMRQTGQAPPSSLIEKEASTEMITNAARVIHLVKTTAWRHCDVLQGVLPVFCLVNASTSQTQPISKKFRRIFTLDPRGSTYDVRMDIDVEINVFVFASSR